MAGPNGPVKIPFSNVAGAFKSNYKLDPSDRDRYHKDLQYAPVPEDKPLFTMLPTGNPDVPSLGGGVVSAVKSLPGVLKGLAHLAAPPETNGETAADLLGVGATPLLRMGKGVVSNEQKAGQQTMRYLPDANTSRQSGPVATLLDLARAGTSALSMINPLNPGGSAGMNEAIDEGRPNDALGEGLVQGAMFLGPEVLRGIGRGTKSLVQRGLDEPMAGTEITPRQRYEAAKAQGVNLPVTQATNSPILRSLDKLNEGGLLGGPTREAANTRNVNALTAHTQGNLDAASVLDPESGGKAASDDLRGHFTDLQNDAHTELNRMSPVQGAEGGQLLQPQLQAPFNALQERAGGLLHEMSPLDAEQGGARRQALLKERMDQMHADATQGYRDVSENYGDLPANNVGSIVQTAEDIGKKNSRFSEQFPSLESKRMMGVVGDAAQLGSPSQMNYLGAPQIGDLIRSRSALLDLTRDPEIVKSSYGGDIQRLIAAHDQAIMDSLPEKGQQSWREANAKWESMKNTFDNPSSPYFSAIRTPNTSTLTRLPTRTPEAVRTEFEHTGNEGKGIIRRGTTEGLLGSTAKGGFDLGNFGSKLEREPEAFRRELYGDQTPYWGAEDRFHAPLQKIASDYQQMQPFESDAFTSTPEKLVHGVGPKTGAGIERLRAHGVNDEGIGALRRGVGEDLLGSNDRGEYNLNKLGVPLERMDGEFFGPHEQELQRIGNDYREMKPFEGAAYTENPESLVHGEGLGPKTAAGVRKLRDLPMKPEGAAGPAAPRIGAEGMGAIQRGAMTDLLGKNSEGGFNFKQLPNALKNANEGYLQELLGPDAHQQLKNIGTTSKALDVDYNRSGSGKMWQKAAEFGLMTTPLPYLQYPLAKFLTSPKVSEWMMRPQGPRGGRIFVPPQVLPPAEEKKKQAAR